MAAGNDAAALTYAERLGWSVFPLAGKTPAIAGGRGCLDATTDAATIAAWWRRYPMANVGVATGSRAGFWVLDIDGAAGRASLEALERDHCRLPATVRQITGGGGEHYLFAWDPARPVRNRTGIRPGLDARAGGGYVVVPPSAHPVTWQRYRWRSDCHPLRRPLAAAPEWLTSIVAPPPTETRAAPRAPTIEGTWGPAAAYSRAAIENACEAIRRAPIGQQEATLNREAYSIGQLVASGHMPRDLARRLLEWAAGGMANAGGRRPWVQSEISAKVARAFADAERHPHAPDRGTR